MASQQTTSRLLNSTLWVAQILVASTLVWASAMKLVQPVDRLAAMWPWVGQVPVELVKFTGVIDLLGALGLILPSLLRVQPRLTPIAAIGIIVLMICASAFHITRGEASVIDVNVVFALIAAFIAWGRFRKVPIAPK